MIAFRNNLPVVRFEDGHVMDFNGRWLSEALALAATRCGYQKWWLVEHVTQTVLAYLRHDFEAPAISPDTVKRIHSELHSGS